MQVVTNWATPTGMISLLEGLLGDRMLRDLLHTIVAAASTGASGFSIKQPSLVEHSRLRRGLRYLVQSSPSLGLND